MGLLEDYRNETGKSPYIEMTLYEGEIEDFISDEYAEWLESKVKKLEAELISLREDNERLRKALKWVQKTQKRFYGYATDLHVEMLKFQNIYSEALNAEQGGK